MFITVRCDLPQFWGFAAFTLAETDREAILARVRENIASFQRRFSRPYRVSFSTGIVTCDPSSTLTLEDYLLKADRKQRVTRFLG